MGKTEGHSFARLEPSRVTDPAEGGDSTPRAMNAVRSSYANRRIALHDIGHDDQQARQLVDPSADQASSPRVSAEVEGRLDREVERTR